MKKSKKIKMIVSKPARQTNEKKSLVVAVGKEPLKKSLATSQRGTPRLSDFSLEEEAAKLAYRYGMISQDNEPRQVATPTEEEPAEEEELSHRKTEREMVTKDREDIIEKLARKIGSSEEKEGWEAFYN